MFDFLATVAAKTAMMLLEAAVMRVVRTAFERLLRLHGVAATAG